MLEILFKIGKILTKKNKKKKESLIVGLLHPKQVVLGSSPTLVGIFVFIFYQYF